MSIPRLTAGSAATLSVTFTSGSTFADPGAVTVGVTRDDGTDVLAAGTATNGTGATARTATLTAAQTTQLDILTATWHSASLDRTMTQRYEVIGGRYLTLWEIRQLRNLSSASDFTDAKLEEARTWWETLVEEHCSQSFVPKYAKERLSAVVEPHKSLRWRYPRTIRSAVDADGNTLDVSGWRLRDSGAVFANVSLRDATIVYEHGHNTPDAEIAEAGKDAIRMSLLEDRSGSPSRELSISTDQGLIRMAQPGDQYPTGVPSIDRVLNARRGILVA